MAIKLIANYSKRLGLPGYSSHQFSIEIEAELSTAEEVPHEAARIYELLQANVDEQIQATGFIPPGDYGMNQLGGGRDNIASRRSASASAIWLCTPRQREVIENFVAENRIDKREVESLAQHRFGKGVRQLRKQEASGFIDELFATYGEHRSENNSTRRAA